MLSAAALERLRAVHHGPVIGPDDPRYEGSRETFNALTQARPEVIVRPVGAEDAVTAISFARDQGVPVSIRGGGHSVAGHCVGEGSVMIDLRLLREVSVDPEARIATAGGGAWWIDVDAKTQGFGLAVPGGTYGDTGIGGLTLNGGIGHLIGAFGLTLDNLRAAEVVTGTGQVVRASPETEPELLWALRGGGGNFGVVTSFEFQLHEVSLMTGGLLIHRLQDASAVLRAFRDLYADAPDELTCMPIFAGTEGLLPEGAVDDDQILLTSVAYVGHPRDAATAVEALRAAATPLIDTVGSMFYSQVQGLFPYAPFGLRHYWTGRFVNDIDDDLIDFTVKHFASAPPGSFSNYLFEPMHGAASRADPDSAAFAFRDARFNVSAMAVWEDPAADDEQIAWARELRDRLQPLSAGGYLNYSTDDSAETVEGAFGSERFARLRAIKTTWDPDNLFRFNHNIPPA